MKSSKIWVIFILVFVLSTIITACGSNEASSSQQQSEAVQSSIQAETDQVAAASEVIPTADSKASVDNLLGSWTDINSPDSFANIIKTDTGYQFQDNDGKYPAEFIDGVLKVKVSDNETDTADVYIDVNTSHMLVDYQGSTSEYSKK
jgi:hypothetical protein